MLIFTHLVCFWFLFLGYFVFGFCLFVVLLVFSGFFFVFGQSLFSPHVQWIKPTLFYMCDKKKISQAWPIHSARHLKYNNESRKKFKTYFLTILEKASLGFGVPSLTLYILMISLFLIVHLLWPSVVNWEEPLKILSCGKN